MRKDKRRTKENTFLLFFSFQTDKDPITFERCLFVNLIKKNLARAPASNE